MSAYHSRLVDPFRSVAGALRPVVILMLLATVLFVVDGVLDGAYPGGGAWFGEAFGGLGPLTYAFALANLITAVLIARGSERTLAARIAIAGFFLVERPLTAFLLGPKPAAAVAVHLATGLVELVILLGAVRIWRIGHAYGAGDVDALFALRPGIVGAQPEPTTVREAGAELARPAAWLLGALTALLATVFVAGGWLAGFAPGGRPWGLAGESAGWLVYAFAAVALAVGALAVRGREIALRVLFALGLVFFLERALTPFALRLADPALLALHALGAFAAIGVAIAAASAIRASSPAREHVVVAHS
ncbi:MAG: hypothetical protein ACRDF0_04615 [Candidatus Limnocylindria bacterium]